MIAYASVLSHLEPFLARRHRFERRHLLSDNDFLRSFPDYAIHRIAPVEVIASMKPSEFLKAGKLAMVLTLPFM